MGEFLVEAMGKTGSDELQECGTSRTLANQAQSGEYPSDDQCLDSALSRTEPLFKK